MHRRRNTGFTLVELMVTIAIVAILVAVAFPSFQGSLRSNRVAAATNELLASISLARTEAIRSTGSAGLCAADATGAACVDVNNWNNGWLVWTNTNADQNYQPGTDTLVRYVQSQEGIVLTVPGSAAATPALSTRILFDSHGRQIDHPATGRALDLRPDICPKDNELVRNMALSGVGQVVTAKVACP
ncbi:MAG: GspH/FimT family pseudopilin [Luteimonas sp.]